MISPKTIDKILASRKSLIPEGDGNLTTRKAEAEGGCGVIGIASSERIPGRHLFQALEQMRNRGNGKGGGIAAIGLVPEDLGVTREILENDYLLAIAFSRRAQGRKSNEAASSRPSKSIMPTPSPAPMTRASLRVSTSNLRKFSCTLGE